MVSSTLALLDAAGWISACQNWYVSSECQSTDIWDRIAAMETWWPTLDAGFLDPARDAGLADAAREAGLVVLDAGFAEALETGLTDVLDDGLAATLDAGLEDGFAFEAGFA